MQPARGVALSKLCLRAIGLRLPLALSLVAATALLDGCSSSGATDPARTTQGVEPGPLGHAFARAAERTAVPRDLLVAIAHVEQGLDVPAQRLDLDDDAAVPAAGPLMLRRGKLDTLARGAALSGVDELTLRKDADLALEAGALVLAELGGQTAARTEDLGSWKLALERLSGYADEAHRAEYAHRVFATLARGGHLPARDGEVIALGAHDLPPTLTLDVSSKLHTLSGSQFPAAQWIPTSCAGKCNADRGGAAVQYIVIHDTEGGWDASVATLQNDPGKSVQYIIGTDGKVGQFVTEETNAWHAGNSFFNQRSVGIEHVGYATKPFSEAQYQASAKLVDHLATKYGVAKDRAHIIGHDQIPNGNKIASSSAPCADAPKSCEANLTFGGASNHSDPGIWEWPTFMARLGASAKCNDVTAIWNCSNDKTHAFRCAGAKVSVEVCDGSGACEVKPSGQDDVCNVKPASAPPPNGLVTPPSDPAPPTTTGATVTEPEVDGAPEASGCTVSHRAGGGWLGMALFAMTLALAASRRTRRSWPSSREVLRAAEPGATRSVRGVRACPAALARRR